MIFDNPEKPWLPALVGGLGVLFSILLWAAFYYQLWGYVYIDPKVEEAYHPWITLILGLGFSFLLARIIRISQLAKARSITLGKINQDLIKEIAERINAEETKQKLEIALLQGQKLQAMGTLAGGIAHDFNNLLYAIIGYVEISQEDVDKSSLVFKNLGKVLEAAHRGQELVARILAFSRRQHQHFDHLHVKNTIEAALSLLRPTIPASVIVNFEPTIDAIILANQTKIHQVLVNLINNAVDAMDGEGVITIKLSRVPADDPYLKDFHDLKPGAYCKIEISDTGHGMDRHTMERIFEPFFTTKEVGKGTGLGLSIVHSIVKEHEGEIFVKSQLGRGTTFTLLLPEEKKE